MNIRVDLNTPINDGTEVVFRSPADCSQVTGLIVYYNGESKEFAFADAHGNNVGDIDHLFAENVVVKVILDVTTSMAFVQNADTNAYLEWRFQDTIDKCCPTFTESGAMVTCEPVEGYPLTVTAEEGATITRCGKNLLSDDWKDLNNWTPISDTASGFLIPQLHPGTYCLGLWRNEIVYARLEKSVDGGTNWEQVKYFATNTSTPEKEFAAFTVSGEPMEQFRLWISHKYFSRITHLQIEAGSARTDAEEYHGETFSVLETVPAWQGVNNIWADVGNVTVKGKADPTVVISKLTNAIIALGGNV